jgi:integrase
MTGSSAPRLQRAQNGIWYIHWVVGRRSKRISTRTRDIAFAKVILAHRLLDDADRTIGPNPIASITRRQGGETCARLWNTYRAQHVGVNSASPQTADWSWNNLKGHFGRLSCDRVTQQVVDSYVKKRLSGRIAQPSKPATVRRELNYLRSCFNWCAHPKRKMLPPAEVPQFDLPAESDPRDRWLRPNEIHSLRDVAAEMRRGPRLSRGERFLWLALETAARKTAILELTWDRVDFETGVIHYDVPGRKKTNKRRTSVPISKALRPVLERALAERLDKDRIDGLVLDNKGGVWPILKRIAKRAGVDGVSPHVFRHTAATYMARRGVPLWKIAGVLGNTMSMVEKVYAKHAPDGLLEAVNAISPDPMG